MRTNDEKNIWEKTQLTRFSKLKLLLFAERLSTYQISFSVLSEKMLTVQFLLVFSLMRFCTQKTRTQKMACTHLEGKALSARELSYSQGIGLKPISRRLIENSEKKAVGYWLKNR